MDKEEDQESIFQIISFCEQNDHTSLTLTYILFYKQQSDQGGMDPSGSSTKVIFTGEKTEECLLSLLTSKSGELSVCILTRCFNSSHLYRKCYCL